MRLEIKIEDDKTCTLETPHYSVSDPAGMLNHKVVTGLTPQQAVAIQAAFEDEYQTGFRQGLWTAVGEATAAVKKLMEKVRK